MLSTRPMRRFAFVLTGFGMVALLSLAGCGQGVGERCQVNSDCADGLVCAAATKSCLTSNPPLDGGGGADGPLDAAIDGAPDAAPDAAVALDASVDAP